MFPRFASTGRLFSCWLLLGSAPCHVGQSQGELLREGFDETMTIDPGNPALLYQGMPRDAREPSYVLLPYRLALLRPAGAPLP